MRTGIGDEPYYKRYGFSKALKLIKAQGYDCIDFQGLCDTTTDLWTCGEAGFEKKLLEMKREIEDNGLEISQTHGAWRWPPQDFTDEQRAERFEKMSKGIRGNAILGCKNFVIHPIMPYGWQEEPDTERFQALNLDYMSRLTEVGKANDVIVCFENMPMPALSLASPQQCLDFAKKINSPWFKICLDTGHCTMLNVKPADAVRILGKDYLQVLHVHDNDGHGDLHWVPYAGVIDWDDFSDALVEIGFDGVVSLETFVPKNYPEAMRPLQEQSLYLSAYRIANNIK